MRFLATQRPPVSIVALSAILLSSCGDAALTFPTEGTRWLHVSAGGAHTCAVSEMGAVACWGSNSAGQLGLGGDVRRVSRPVLVRGGRSYVEVDAGEAHTCALDTAGGAWCWGLNDRGQLGDGTTQNRSHPVRADVGDRFVRLSAGGGHTCAVDAAGRALCWGDNRLGQLGGGTFGLGPFVGAVGAGVPRFFSVSAGGAHTCGVTRAGAGRCWGSNEDSALGAGSTASSPYPIRVGGGLLFHSIEAGERHTCGVVVTGTLRCWGANDWGQIGAGTQPRAGTPIWPGGTSHVHLVLTGGRPWSCAGADTGMTCWGVRIGASEPGGIPVPGNAWSPEVGAGLSILEGSAGGLHGCVLTAEGRIACFGEGGDGQLGTGDRESTTVLRWVVG